MENKEVLNNKFLERDYAHAYASFGLRAFAFIVDMLVIGAINKILINVLGIDLDYEIYGIEMAEILRWIVTILYFAIISLVTKGQSLGKMIVGIRVVSLTSDKLDLGQILIREIAQVHSKYHHDFISFANFYTKKPKPNRLFRRHCSCKRRCLYRFVWGGF